MRREETYKWLTRWNGKLSPTRFHATEEEIRKTYPDAVRVEGSLVVREIPETAAEWAERNKATQTHSSAERRHPDGTTKKFWEK